MRPKRRLLKSELYFVTIRTVEQRFALDPYACPNAWIRVEGREIDIEEKQSMRKEGQLCVERTRTLTEVIARAEQDPTQPLPVVPLCAYTDSIENIIGACMARGIALYGVHLYGFVWMSNHGHLLLRAPSGNFAEFMGYLNGQIAVNVNRFLAREDQLWARRYAAAPVLDEAAELDRLGYLLANPQNAGVADSIDTWAGLSSATFFFTGREQRFLSFHRTAWHEAGCPEDIGPFLSTTKLEHKLLPQLSDLDTTTRRKNLRQLIKRNLSAAPLDPIKVDTDPTLPVRRRLLARTVIPTDRPESAKKEPRKYSSRQPICHTTQPLLWKIYKECNRVFRAAYAEVSAKYRSGEVNVIFPPGSFAPSKYPPAKYADDPDAHAMLHPTRENLEWAALHATIAT